MSGRPGHRQGAAASTCRTLEERLVLDPRILVDPGFLGTLHRELRMRLGDGEARSVLLQTGFFHGLRDALRIGGITCDEGASPRTAPLLPMHLVGADPGAVPPVTLRGSWPERVEAEALLTGLGVTSDPSCFVSSGYTSGWLSGLWEGDFVAVEVECAARGDVACCFEAREAEVWRRQGDPQAASVLAALPFAALRAMVDEDRSGGSGEPRAAASRVDPRSPAIHVWGPVMIVPYSGEETAASVEILAREPATRDVCVVIVDLSGAVLDAGFGAVALERTLDAIESWGAEAILSGCSPLSASVVAGVARSSLMLQKDLGEAIAAAFQIVEAQRHPT